jgi:hypothetical protein
VSAAVNMIETELWLSFVSMLRSYAAAASLHAGQVSVSAREKSVRITFGASQLDMQFDSDTCQIDWARRTGSEMTATGSFAIEADGTIHIDGMSKDLDHAAIDLIASVTTGGKGSRP